MSFKLPSRYGTCVMANSAEQRSFDAVGQARRSHARAWTEGMSTFAAVRRALFLPPLRQTPFACQWPA
jgi:hypothetical protein